MHQQDSAGKSSIPDNEPRGNSYAWHGNKKQASTPKKQKSKNAAKQEPKEDDDTEDDSTPKQQQQQQQQQQPRTPKEAPDHDHDDFCSVSSGQTTLTAGSWREQDMPDPPGCRKNTNANGNNAGGNNGGVWALADGSECSCAEPKSDYHWKPERCKVVPWSAKGFCKMLGLRTIMFIGDSTMLQTADVVYSSIAEGKGGCEQNILTGLSDTLIGSGGFGSFGHKVLGEEWTSYINESRPDIVVLGAGAKVFSGGTALRKDGRKPMARYTVLIKKVIEDYNHLHDSSREGGALYTKEKPLTLVWKTTNPGGCAENISSAGGVSPESDLFWKGYHRRGDPFGLLQNYNSFMEFDNAAADYFSEFGFPVADVRMLHWRRDAKIDSQNPDKRRDCLHFCMRNGALYDTVPRMIMHALIASPSSRFHDPARLDELNEAITKREADATKTQSSSRAAVAEAPKQQHNFRDVEKPNNDTADAVAEVQRLRESGNGIKAVTKGDAVDGGGGSIMKVKIPSWIRRWLRSWIELPFGIALACTGLVILRDGRKRGALAAIVGGLVVVFDGLR
jgi:hypothetical protein